METGETCLYNKSIKNKHKEVYGMKKKNDDGTDGIHGFKHRTRSGRNGKGR